jgi:hypothetical protein
MFTRKSKDAVEQFEFKWQADKCKGTQAMATYISRRTRLDIQWACTRTGTTETKCTANSL